MTLRHGWFLALLCALVALPFALAAPVPGVAKQDAEGDPLPKGAKARLGTARMRNLDSAPTGLYPPTYDALLVPDRTGVGFRLLDPTTGNIRPDLLGSREMSPSNLVYVTPDGARILTQGYIQNGTLLKVWNLKAAKELASLEVKSLPYGKQATSLSANGHRLAYGSTLDTSKPENKDKFATATIYDVEGNKPLQTVTVLQNNSCQVWLSPDGATLATWGTHNDPKRKYDDPTPNLNLIMQLWNCETGKEIARIPFRDYNDPRLAFSPDGKLFAVGGTNSGIELRTVQDGKPVISLAGRSGQGHITTFSPDNKTVASIDYAGEAVQRWDVASGALIGTTLRPVDKSVSINQLVFSGNDRIVVFGRSDNASFVWEAPSGKLLSPLGGHFGSVTGIGFFAGGKEVLTCGSDSQLLRWNAVNGRLIGQLELGGCQSLSVRGLSNDATKMFPSSGSGRVSSITPPSELFAIPAIGETSGVLRPTEDGTKGVVIHTTYNDKVKTLPVTAWDLVSARKLGEVQVPKVGYEGTFATILSDGKRLVTMHTVPPKDAKNSDEVREFAITGWELPSGKKLGELLVPKKGYGLATVISVDEKTVGVLLPGPKFLIVDIVTGKQVREIPLGNRAPSAEPMLSPDRRLLAVPTESGYGPRSVNGVYLFDWATGKPLKKFIGHSSQVTMVAFSPDSKTLATGSNDTTAILWDVEASGESFTVQPTKVDE